MPLMNGFAATEKLKKLFRAHLLETFTIIACTAGVTRTEITRCKRSGFDEVLAKPISSEKVRAMLEKCFK